MVGVRGLAILVFVVLACIAASPALAQPWGPDGRPRPAGYPDTPTMAYGPTPPCYLNNVVITCEWYGFAHILYPTMGAVCLADTRRVLANTTLFAPGDLAPYEYYYLRRYVFDTTTNTSYCLYGCFAMSASASPPLGFAPPPATVATPPPAVLYPPLRCSTLPCGALPSPSLLYPPPAADLAPPPVTLSTPPPASVPPTPEAVPPPPPGGTRVINLNGAGFLRPTGLLSFIISGALLILNGLVAF